MFPAPITAMSRAPSGVSDTVLSIVITFLLPPGAPITRYAAVDEVGVHELTLMGDGESMNCRLA